jgi:hypothetical protein
VAQIRPDRRDGGAGLELADYYASYICQHSLACLMWLSLAITPERPAGWREPNHGSRVDRHLPVLRIFPAQAAHGFGMSGAAMKNLCLATDQNISELLPILAVAIDHQSGLRIRLNVDHSPELRRARSLRFLVNRGIEIFSIKNKADGYNVRLTVKASGSEMGDPRGTDEGERFLCERHGEGVLA